jgi:hypothetical protein
MSHYYLESDRYIITYGYDHGLKSFSLIIHCECAGAEIKNQPLDEFIFHYMKDWPHVRMTINDVKYVLQEFGERIPENDLYRLYYEAKNCGYFSMLNVEDFKYLPPYRRFAVYKRMLVEYCRKVWGAIYVHFKAGVRMLGRLH